MATPLFNRVVIVGPGLIGGSLGMALRARGLARRVIGVGRRVESLNAAKAAGAIDEASLVLEEAAEEADLVLLATTVGAIPLHAGAVLPKMKPGAILTDVGSVKGTICHAVRQIMESNSVRGAFFVGSHPLAGSEQRGIEAARKDLFEGSLCILTPDVQTDPNGAALRSLRTMWQAVGCCVEEMSPHAHDGLLAQCSHLPHAIAACLVNGIDDEALRIASRGFLDTTRIASGDPALWVDICLANRAALRKALESLETEMRDFADALDACDADALLRFLQRAKRRRDLRLQ